MEPAEPAGGGRAGLRRGVPSALVEGGGSKEGAPLPHPKGRRGAPERHCACCCTAHRVVALFPPPAWRERAAGNSSSSPQPPCSAEVRCSSADARCCGAAASPAETTAPGVQRAQRLGPCAGTRPRRHQGPGLAGPSGRPSPPRPLAGGHSGAVVASQRFPLVLARVY